MSAVAAVAKGLAAPVTDVIEARELTERARIAGNVAALEAGQATWRPRIARALGVALVWWLVVASMGMLGWGIGVWLHQPWAGVDGIAERWLAVWIGDVGRDVLLWLVALFLTPYTAGRSLEKALGRESGGGGVLGGILGRGRARRAEPAYDPERDGPVPVVRRRPAAEPVDPRSRPAGGVRRPARPGGSRRRRRSGRPA